MKTEGVFLYYSTTISNTMCLKGDDSNGIEKKRKKEKKTEVTRTKIKKIGKTGIIFSNFFIFIALLPGNGLWVFIAGTVWTISLCLLSIAQRSVLIKIFYMLLVLIIWISIFKIGILFS